jgi:hypothetical protein
MRLVDDYYVVIDVTSMTLHDHGRMAMLISGDDALDFAICGRLLHIYTVPKIGNSMDALATNSMSAAAGLQWLTLVDGWDVNRQRDSTFSSTTATVSWHCGLTVLGVFVNALLDVPCWRIVPTKDGIESDLWNIVISAGMVGYDVVVLAGRVLGAPHVPVLLAYIVE